MRRTSLFLLLLLAVAGVFGGLPFWFGMQAETAYSDVMQRIANTKDGEVTVSQSEYVRGWFSSSADMTLTSTSFPVSVTVSSKIYHGPFPRIEEFEFEPMMALIKSQVGVSTVKDLPPINAQTAFALDGASHTQLTLAAHKTPWGDLQWQDISGEITISADRKQSKTNLQIPEISVTSPLGGKQVISNLRLSGSEQEHASGTSLVDSILSIDKVGALGEKPLLEGLRVTLKNDVGGGGLLTLHLSADLRTVSDGDTSHGPGQMALQLRKLDLAALNAYQAQMRDLRKQKNPEQAAMASMGKVMELVANLSKKAPELELTKFSFKSGGGEIVGQAKFVLDGSNLNLSENPMLFVVALQGDAEFKLPAGVVKLRAEKAIRSRLEMYKQTGTLKPEESAKLTSERIKAIVEQALPEETKKTAESMRLVPDGEGYKFTLALKQGQLTINGSPVETPRLPL